MKRVNFVLNCMAGRIYSSIKLVERFTRSRLLICMSFHQFPTLHICVSKRNVEKCVAILSLPATIQQWGSMTIFHRRKNNLN